MMEGVYEWLRQIIIFYILSVMVINVVSEKYINYIRLVTRTILILLVITPLLNITGQPDTIKNKLENVYKEYSTAYYSKALSGQVHTYNTETVLTEAVSLKAKNLLREYSAVLKKAVVDVNEADEEAANINKITIYTEKLKKSDQQAFKSRLSEQLGIEKEKICVV